MSSIKKFKNDLSEILTKHDENYKLNFETPKCANSLDNRIVNSEKNNEEIQQKIKGKKCEYSYEMFKEFVTKPEIMNIPKGSKFDDYEFCRLIYQKFRDEINECEIDQESFQSLFIMKRKKIKDINSLEQLIDLIKKSNSIVILTGAGCSVSCGIPDFRSKDGIYAKLKLDYPDLNDPQSMFDINFFKKNPRPFFKFAKEIYPGKFKPSLSHLFIKKLEESGKLLRNYTQNIDTLELVAQIRNVIQCHGSFATASCTKCTIKIDGNTIREKIYNQEIPFCENCNKDTKHPTKGLNSTEIAEENNEGILKPDIVFFGENLPESFYQAINIDKKKCDLLIVIGSSLKVSPVANIPHLIDQSVPQILINRESLSHFNFDIELLGDCDVIIKELLLRLNKQDNYFDESDKIQNYTKDFNWCDILDKDQQNLKLLEKIEDDNIENIILDSFLEKKYLIDEKSDTLITSVTENKLQVNENQLKFTNHFLKENSFIYLKPNIYVFHGAEINSKIISKKLKKLRNLNLQDGSNSNDIFIGLKNCNKNEKINFIDLTDDDDNEENRSSDTDFNSDHEKYDEYESDDDINAKDYNIKEELIKKSSD